MPRQRKHRQRRVRSGRFWGLYVFLTAILIALVVVGGSIVFFKVNTFDLRLKTPGGNVVCLEGNSRYTEQQVIEACGVNYQDNLCLVKKTSVASHILKNLNYVSGVSVTRRLPGTLVITLTESKASAAVSSGEKWYVIDTNGKILEEADTPPEVTRVEGLVLKDPRVGKRLQVYDGPSEEYEGNGQHYQLQALLALLPALEGRNLMGEITSFDLSSDSEVYLLYQNRLKVKLPLDADYEYQVKMLNSILTEYVSVNWSDSDKGVLDMTYQDGRTHLTRSDDEEDS